ncbi:MAG TPA: carotenoid oxygenase family protein, partial [Candidatus Elarobacter sp.]|nr:carotenoid oxygenase family protein [Candidatus Elarobacter sp.]
GRLRTPFTAHPKRCPRTGELHAIGMHYTEGLTYHRVDANGELTVSRHIEVPRVTMMHDFALTRDHVLFLDLPVVFNVMRALRRDMPFAWSDRYGARIGVLRRDDPHGDVRWYDIAPCYVFHVLNAYERGEEIVLDAVRYEDMWREGTGMFPRASLHRWTIDTAAGAVRESRLDDRAIEFPRHDQRLLGEPYRYGYTVDSAGDERSGLRKYDLAAGTSVVRDFGAGTFAAEAVFVPREGSHGEDDGWLMAFVYDAGRDASDFVVLDAATLETTATVALPQRVPFGFHGNWISDAELA